MLTGYAPSFVKKKQKIPHTEFSTLQTETCTTTWVSNFPGAVHPISPQKSHHTSLPPPFTSGQPRRKPPHPFQQQSPSSHRTLTSPPHRGRLPVRGRSSAARWRLWRSSLLPSPFTSQTCRPHGAHTALSRPLSPGPEGELPAAEVDRRRAGSVGSPSAPPGRGAPPPSETPHPPPGGKRRRAAVGWKCEGKTQQP